MAKPFQGKIELDIRDSMLALVEHPEAAQRLRDVFESAEVVVHLAWAMQPNHDEPVMQATNVHGTARMLQAAGAADVPHVVVLSSVGVAALVGSGSRPLPLTVTASGAPVGT